MLEARDQLDRYFTEKIWELIPAIHRHEDGLGDRPGTLRALVEVFARQAATLRRSADRLWEDAFVDNADDWAVAYIADLVATRLVSALDARGRRADVANTIHYRRRAGTLRVLEQLIGDIGGFEGASVEMLRKLGRSWHRLDPAPRPVPGQISKTPPGGFADLRMPRVAGLVDGPFDELSHTIDVRRHSGRRGRHNIPKLAFHVYRLAVFQIRRGEPALHSDAEGVNFTFDPSGRDVPLFVRRGRRSGEAWRAARPWELPGPMTCRLLDDALYIVTDSVIQQLVTSHGLGAGPADVLRSISGQRFRGEGRLRIRLGALPGGAVFLAPSMYDAILFRAISEECGKRALWPASAPLDGSVSVEETPGTIVVREKMAAGRLDPWTGAIPEKRLLVDPDRGRFRFMNGAAPAATDLGVSYVYAFSAAVGAGPYDRSAALAEVPAANHRVGGGALAATDMPEDAVAQIDDSRTYGPIADRLAVRNMTLQAADRERPYVRATADWVLDSGATLDAFITIDGLWIGADSPHALVLRGDYERVTIAHATLDPGGIDADGAPIPAMSLRIEGKVEELRIVRSVLGPIDVVPGAIVEKLVIEDSVVQSRTAGVRAITMRGGEAHLSAVTIFGTSRFHRLWGSEVIATDFVNVVDTQNGCFRFGAAPETSRLPHPYQCHLGGETSAWFGSRLFGHPAYAQLTSLAPERVRRGAESMSEMGAFSRFSVPIRDDSMRTKVDEYLPFGLIPMFVYET